MATGTVAPPNPAASGRVDAASTAQRHHARGPPADCFSPHFPGVTPYRRIEEGDWEHLGDR